MKLTAFDGQYVAEFEGPPDGHACQRALGIISQQLSVGKSLLAPDDCELLGDDRLEAGAYVVADPVHDAAESDGVVQVLLLELLGAASAGRAVGAVLPQRPLTSQVPL